MTFTNPAYRFRPALLFGGVLLLTVFTEHVVTTLPAFRQQQLLPVGVTFDLLVFVPAVFYFLVVRPYGIRRMARRVAIYLDQPRQFVADAGLYCHFPTR